VTANPNSGWVTQQARNLLLVLGERERRLRLVLHDRDTTFTRSFDDMFCAEDAEMLVTPVQAPNANAHAERWIRTARAECLDWLLIVGRGHLEQVLRVYVQHYNAHRAHRALGLQPPDPAVGLTLTGKDQPDRIYRRDLKPGPDPDQSRSTTIGVTAAPSCWRGHQPMQPTRLRPHEASSGGDSPVLPRPMSPPRLR